MGINFLREKSIFWINARWPSQFKSWIVFNWYPPKNVLNCKTKSARIKYRVFWHLRLFRINIWSNPADFATNSNLFAPQKTCLVSPTISARSQFVYFLVKTRRWEPAAQFVGLNLPILGSWVGIWRRTFLKLALNWTRLLRPVLVARSCPIYSTKTFAIHAPW